MANIPKVFETAFNTYSVTAVIGEGGSGRVFAVKDDDGQTFALKCLFPNKATTEKRKRFKNEFDFCHKYRHPNIIQVIDSGLAVWDEEKCPFYVMPCYSMTLRKLIDKGLTTERVLPLFSNIIDGVEAAHILKVIHRDLKPENILCGPEGTSAVVADFGIAHFEEDMLLTAVETLPKAILANLRYSAPEQRTRGASVDRGADIFALGLILNEMFTGSVPQGTGYATIASVAPNYSYLDSIVERMIQQSPNARFSNIEDIKKELIGRRNEFVRLQELNKKRGEVVPASAPPMFDNISLTGEVDWQPETQNLVMHLNRVPDNGWIQRFKHPSVGYTSIGGATPRDFIFTGDRVSLGTEAHNVQTVIDHFKRFLILANEAYVKDLDNAAQNEQNMLRQKLEQEVKSAETRAQVLANIKI